jgi:hypothetical protein
MPRLIAIIIAMLSTVYGMTAWADVVTDWDQNAIEVLKAANILGDPFASYGRHRWQ